MGGAPLVKLSVSCVHLKTCVELKQSLSKSPELLLKLWERNHSFLASHRQQCHTADGFLKVIDLRELNGRYRDQPGDDTVVGHARGCLMYHSLVISLMNVRFDTVLHILILVTTHGCHPLRDNKTEVYRFKKLSHSTKLLIGRARVLTALKAI